MFILININLWKELEDDLSIDLENDTSAYTFWDQLRQALNVIFAITQATSPFFAYITGLGQPIWTRSGVVETPATPATYTFFIWLFIFLTSIAYSFYQALPGRRTDLFLRRVGFFTAAAFLGSTLWEVDNQLHGVTWLSVVLIVLVLAAISGAFIEVVRKRASLTTAERWLVALPISVLMGWESIASFAVLSQALKASGFDNFGFSEAHFSIVTVIAAGVFGAIVTFLSRGNWDCGLAIIWALMGIVVANVTRQQNDVVASTASGMALLVALTLLPARR